MAIVAEKHGDALDAEENFLLVPAPIKQIEGFYEGFISQVFDRFPEAEARVRDIRGVKAAEIELVAVQERESNSWLPAYTLAIAGIHYREPDGWNEAADLLRIALNKLRGEAPQGGVKLATAGIPGNGLSGLRGGSSVSGIENVLINHPMEVVVYRRGQSGDRARVLHAEPPKQLRTEALVPRSYVERHPAFSHPQ